VLRGTSPLRLCLHRCAPLGCRRGCAEGMTSVAGEPCQPGKFTPAPNGNQAYSGAVIGAPCQVCPGGKYSGPAALGCTDCVPGKYSVAGVCLDCLAGTYGSTAGNPNPFCDGRCIAPIGYGCYAGSTSATGVVCPKGTYNDAPGISAGCTVCPAGRYGDSTGLVSSSCSGECAAADGTECVAGSTMPSGTPCPAGKYSKDPLPGDRCAGGAHPLPLSR
jgi:hypothetical protein